MYIQGVTKHNDAELENPLSPCNNNESLLFRGHKGIQADLVSISVVTPLKINVSSLKNKLN